MDRARARVLLTMSTATSGQPVISGVNGDASPKVVIC